MQLAVHTESDLYVFLRWYSEQDRSDRDRRRRPQRTGHRYSEGYRLDHSRQRQKG